MLSLSTVTAASAVTNFTPTMTASNGSITVGATSDGQIGWSTDNTNWNMSNSSLNKNGISSLNYFPSKNLFIATSFFSASVSNDGKTWSNIFLPVGEKFNPEDIISDAEFFGATSMSVNDIQNFINSKILATLTKNCLKI